MAKVPTPLHRGQGNEPYRVSDPRQGARRGQLHPYNINGAPTGAMVADGNYGDVTVTLSGATWTINANIVTNAKLADMAQGTLKGRAPATGTGDPQDLTLDADGALAANSDERVATQKATKAYVDQIIAAQDAMVFKGVVDCSANPNYPAADRGHTYRVSVAGKIGGASGVNVEVGDILLCLTDGTAAGDQATVGSNWTVIQTNLDGAVIGPAAATNNGFAKFDGVTGKLLKNSPATVSLATDVSGTLAVSLGGTGGSVASGTLLDNITAFSGTGMLARTAAGTYAFRTITGTANEITVTNGNAVSGNPTLSLPTAMTFTGKTVTGGTFTNLTSLGAGNSDFTDPISGTAKFKIVDGTQILSFRDNSDGEGWLVLANSTVIVRFRTLDTQGGVIGTQTNHAFFLKTNNSSRIYIDTSGNVGISNYGIAAPAALSFKLWVDGTLGTTGNCTLGDASSDAHTANGSLTITSYAKVTPVAVASLPAAGTAGVGARAFVNDSTVAASGNFGATVAGGGANNVPVFSDATNWLIG